MVLNVLCLGVGSGLTSSLCPCGGAFPGHRDYGDLTGLQTCTPGFEVP